MRLEAEVEALEERGLARSHRQRRHPTRFPNVQIGATSTAETIPRLQRIQIIQEITLPTTL